jgi:zona occludens toxin (predicted ATPase)
MYNIHTASVSMHGSLFSSWGMVGSVYLMVSGGKCMMTCVSSNIVLCGVSFVVHSSSGMVRIVIVSWFSFVARRAQCMVFCMFSLLCGWAYPLSRHLCLKAVLLDPNIESL